MARTVAEKPGEVNSEQGVVIIDGPGSIAATLTPDDARKMGRRMIAAGKRASAHNLNRPAKR